MNWWAASRLRTKIFVAFSALIVGVLLLTLGLVELQVRRQTERTLTGELHAPVPGPLPGVHGRP